MHPIICSIGPFRIYSYGLMLVIAFLVSSFLAAKEAKQQGIGPDILFNLFFWVFIFGIIGSRIFYVLENSSYYFKNPLEIIMLQKGGLSWFGGLFAGAGLGLAYLKKKNLPAGKILDLAAPYLALAQAIGRFGCLFNGCCGGTLFFMPVQIYASFFLTVIFIILRFLQVRPHFGGQVFLAYLLLYSLKRFFVEFWRNDNLSVLGSLTLFQVLSIAIFFIAGLIYARLSYKRRPASGK